MNTVTQESVESIFWKYSKKESVVLPIVLAGRKCESMAIWQIDPRVGY